MIEQRKSFMLGLVSGFAVLAVLVGVFYLGSQYGKGGSGANDTANAADGGQAPTQRPTIPEADGSKIAKVTSSDHVRGAKNAKVTMIEYSDFECPFCARFTPTVEQALKEYEGKVNLVFRHFPLRQIHQFAQKAAEASECASEQGKFWEMHDKLFALNSAGTFTLETIKQAAADLKLDTSKFNSCLDSGKYTPEVDKDYQDGLAAGVSGTPGTFVSGQYVAGAVPYDQLKSIIDSKL